MGAAAETELHEAGVTVHPVPALHGLGGDEPVVYEFAPDSGPVRFLGFQIQDMDGALRFQKSRAGGATSRSPRWRRRSPELARPLRERYHGLLDRGGPPEWPPSPLRFEMWTRNSRSNPSK